VTAPLGDCQWHHLVVTMQEGKGELYFDGISKGSINNISMYENTTTTLNIGCRHNGNNPCPGIIQDVRVYDHILSPREVKLLSQGLIAHYKLDGLKLTNLMPSTQNYYGEGVTSATVDTTIKKYNASIKVVGGSGGECYIRPNITINYISGHQYYARADIY
jgi:hypothetical protein